jgi:neutral ceramidase
LPIMKRLLTLLLSLITAMVWAQTKTDPLDWKVGVASAKITPDTMMWMAGYASRKEPAEGVELDLYAKAMVIEDAKGSKFALITMDLIGVPRNVRLHVAEQVEKQYNIPPSRLALNASHTHSGPELRSGRGHGVADPAKHEADAAAYTEKLQKTLIGLVGTALNKGVPTTLYYSQARCGFAMNRRLPNGKGGYSNFPNPEGPVDHAVPVLKAADAEGKDLGYVFGYACHCTTLGHQKFSGDYAGYAQAALEEAHPGAVAMFMNGCSGDQNPYPRRTREVAETHGHSLATAVEAALTTKMKRLTGDILAAYEEIPLAYDTLPTREELLEKQKSKEKLDAEHAVRLLKRLDEQGPLPQTYPYPVQVIRLGPELTWVMLAGEVVVDYSLRLKRELTDPVIWVSAYTNDVPSYIPSLRVWKEGGYEGGDAMKWGTHPTRWSRDVEAQIIGTVKKLRAEME